MAHTVAEPGDVADVDKKGRRSPGVRKARAQLLAEEVFVADVGRQALALEIERGLRQRPATEFAQRDVHHVEEPLEEGGNKFAKGNQMVLVVAVNLRLARFQPHHRVGIAVAGVAQRDADQRGAVIAGVALLQRVPVTRRQLTR
jgi:hypothetical protein